MIPLFIYFQHLKNPYSYLQWLPEHRPLDYLVLAPTGLEQTLHPHPP